MLHRMILIVFAVTLLMPVTSLADSSNTKSKTITREEFAKERPANFYAMMESNDPVCQEILDELNKPYKPDWDALNIAPQTQSNLFAANWLGSKKSIFWTALLSWLNTKRDMYRVKLYNKSFYLLYSNLAGVQNQTLLSINDFIEDNEISSNRWQHIINEGTLIAYASDDIAGRCDVIDVMALNNQYFSLATTTCDIEKEPLKKHYLEVRKVSENTQSDKTLCKFEYAYKITP